MVTRKRVMYVACSTSAWVEIAEGLQREARWDPCYWVGRGNIEEMVRSRFPEAAFQDHHAAMWAQGEEIETPALDEPLISRMAVVEQIFLRMVDRVDYAGLYSYAERKKLYYDHVRYWLAVLDRYCPDVLFNPSTPHQLYDFILYELCRMRGIRTIMFGMASDLYRIFCKDDYTYGSGVIGRAYADRISGATSSSSADLAPDIEARLDRIARTYDEAIPQYMLKQQQEARKQPGPLSLKSVVRAAWRMAVATMKLLGAVMTRNSEKWQDCAAGYCMMMEQLYADIIGPLRLASLRRYYEKLSSAVDLSENYVYVPLAYQPEQTSSPEGGVFVDQSLIVDMLSKAVPPGWKILVKEHPSQFRYFMGTNRSSRSHDFYTDLIKRPNVCFLSLSSNPFALIDNAQAVATVSGTAGWEALVRGKPAIHFGYPWWQECEGAFQVTSSTSCAEAIQAIVDGYQVNREKVRLYAQVTDEESCAGDVFWDRDTMGPQTAGSSHWLSAAREMICLVARLDHQLDTERREC
jgi:hypothetical protein